MTKKDLPTIIFYNQDFVDLYNYSWLLVNEQLQQGSVGNQFQGSYFNYPENETINLYEAILSSFFLVYSNRVLSATAQLDNFYLKQEPDGAIRSDYWISDGSALRTKVNPKGISPPLLAWAEYNIYHKVGSKRRLREVMPKLELYWNWIETNFKRKNGLYWTPATATGMLNGPRKEARYLVDFNAQQAINALYMARLGDILNDKDIGFRYNRHYFSIKTRINNLMWNDHDSIYYDLDKTGTQLGIKTIASFWTLLAQLPNDDKFERLSTHLKNPKTFGSKNPFPSLAISEPGFDASGGGWRGSVFTHYLFMIVKGLECYSAFKLAREYTIRHLYYLHDALYPENGHLGDLWEAYQPNRDGPARWRGTRRVFPRSRFCPYVALATITLMIENVLGLLISLPRKTVSWTVPDIEEIGIANLLLKRNRVTIYTAQSNRGWEVRLESGKLYYFTVNILNRKQRTLPIPSGKCSMLIEKL